MFDITCIYLFEPSCKLVLQAGLSKNMSTKSKMLPLWGFCMLKICDIYTGNGVFGVMSYYAKGSANGIVFQHVYPSNLHIGDSLLFTDIK